jgi:signal transduction histidine kinase
MVENITNHRRLGEEALRAQRMDIMVRLVGGIVHDFNNQLTAIMGSAEMGSRLLPEGTQPRNYFQDILKTCDSAVKLSRRLLSFTRADESPADGVDLNDALLDMLTMLRRLIREDIELVVSPSQGKAVVMMDTSEIEQIVSNLVVNARDALPSGGVIAVNAATITVGPAGRMATNGLSPGSYVVVSVKDTGTGMTEAVKARLFEPFFTTKGIGEGTGLGLAVCHEIVKQAGGHIDVRSEPGAGTTFEVYLPCTTDHPTSLTSSVASALAHRI